MAELFAFTPAEMRIFRMVCKAVFALFLAYTAKKEGHNFSLSLLAGLLLSPLLQGLFIIILADKPARQVYDNARGWIDPDSPGEKKRLAALKAEKKIPGISIAVYALLILISYLMISLGPLKSMEGMELQERGEYGDGIVTYYIDDGEYSYNYIPRSLRAGKPENVGAVLTIDEGFESGSAIYSGSGEMVYVDMWLQQLTFRLKDHSTGRLIAEKQFTADVPVGIDSSHDSGDTLTMYVHEEDVKEWLGEVWADYR